MEDKTYMDRFLKGNLIKSFNINSQTMSQVVAEIENSFDVIIDNDKTAIQVVDSFSFFLSTFQKVDVK